MTFAITGTVVFYYLATYIAFGALCAYIGGEKNRSRVNWFIAGFFLGIFGLIAVACVPRMTCWKDNPNGVDDPELAAWKEKMGRK